MYHMKEEQKTAPLFCNCCAREIASENGILKEDVLEIRKEWGFFSKKDLQVHSFVVCESCYDKMMKTFVIPVTKTEKTEVL